MIDFVPTSAFKIKARSNPETMPLDRKIRILQTLVANWGGEAIDGHGLIRLFNRDGMQPPLIWCFNAEHEPAALALALGADQPMIAVRSLNIAVDFRLKRSMEDAEIAAYYIRNLLETFSLMQCRVGGNCQGAAVAAEMAIQLALMGKNVTTFFSMEWMPFIPFPGHCTLIFGSRSKENNPFLRGLDPWRAWRYMFGRASCQIVPGEHGFLFESLTVGNLASAISTAQPTGISGARRTWEWEAEHGKHVNAGQSVRIVFTAAPALSDECRIYAVWIANEPGVGHVTGIYQPSPSDMGYSIFLEAPITDGSWTLKLFLCDRDAGPSCFGEDSVRERRIMVEP